MIKNIFDQIVYIKLFEKCILFVGLANINSIKPLIFYKNVKTNPKFMCIIVGYYEAIIQDKDIGIYIVTITTLKP